MTLNSLIFYFVAFSFILLFVFFLVHIFHKILVHGKTRDRRLALCEHLALTPIESELFTDIVNRTYLYSYTYGIHTSLHLLCSIQSIICSAAALAMLPTSTGPCWQNISISLAALFFVFITIYVKPAQRSAQYLSAWIEAEISTLNYINAMYIICINRSGSTVDQQTQMIYDENCKMIEIRKKIERSITSDFDSN